ncbi:Hca operon transcriptional activator HcaR [compost metagenome]
MLFERSQQRIRLTRDGRTLLAETKAFLTHANRLESLARRLGRGDEGGLCIGYLEYAMHSGVLPNALRELSDGRPAVHIALYNQQSETQLEGLRQRSLDIALVCEPPSPDDPDLEAAQVLNDPMLLVLPAGHPLAEAAQITSADLAAQKWIGVMHKESALRHDTFIAACAKAGFTPTISMEATEPLAALGLVAAGLGVTTVQRSLRHQAPAGIVMRELPEFSYRTPLWAAWHKINLRPLVQTFRETLIKTATDAS